MQELCNAGVVLHADASIKASRPRRKQQTFYPNCEAVHQEETMNYPKLTVYTTLLAALSTLGLSLAGCYQTQTGAPSSEDAAITEVQSATNSEASYKEASVEEQERFLAKQRKMKAQQERELQDLKRQQFHDQYYKSRYATGN